MEERSDGAGDGESPQGHLADRELNELVQELRLILPGTTVLFGFLLSVPFSARYERLDAVDRVVYFVAFVATGVALVFLLAEAGYHRLRGKPYDKQVMIRTTSRQAIGGLISLGVALLACVAFVADFVYDAWAAVAIAVPLAIGSLWMWFGLPLYRRVRGDPPRR